MEHNIQQIKLEKRTYFICHNNGKDLTVHVVLN